jgi:putative ABC transport system substrate-binding protein
MTHLCAMGVTTLPFNCNYNSPPKGRKTMRRREFITLVGGAVVSAWPLPAFGKAQRIIIVHPTLPVPQIVGKPLREFIELAEAAGDSSALGFFKELDRLGYGQSLLVEVYSGQGRVSHYADLAREVVSRNPDLIIPLSTELTLVFKAATTTIPIVGSFAIPVESGIVANLARPGGNITGVAADVGPDQWGKPVQLLQQVAPQATRLAVLHSRAVREQYGPKEQSQWMGVTWVGPPFDQPVDEAEYRRVFAGLVQDHAEGIVVVDESVLQSSGRSST